VIKTPKSFCIICGKDLTGAWYLPDWKVKCFECWKRTELKTESIGKKIKRLKEQGVI